MNEVTLGGLPGNTSLRPRDDETAGTSAVERELQSLVAPAAFQCCSRAGALGQQRDGQFIAKQPASAPHKLGIVPHTVPRGHCRSVSVSAERKVGDLKPHYFSTV